MRCCEIVNRGKAIAVNDACLDTKFETITTLIVLPQCMAFTISFERRRGERYRSVGSTSSVIIYAICTSTVNTACVEKIIVEKIINLTLSVSNEIVNMTCLLASPWLLCAMLGRPATTRTFANRTCCSMQPIITSDAESFEVSVYPFCSQKTATERVKYRKTGSGCRQVRGCHKNTTACNYCDLK